MPAIPFPPSSSPGEKAAEGQGRLVNCLVEKEGSQLATKRAAGLSLFCDTALSTPRGFIEVGGTVYAAYKDVAVTITSAGVVTPLTGALTGSELVTWARNNKSPTPDVVCVADGVPYVVSSATVSAYPDGDLPGSPTCCEGLNGYMLFGYGNGQIWATEPNSTSVVGTSFATAQYRPDGIERLIASNGRLYVFGKESVEVWSDRGTTPFPLGRDAAIAVGLLNKWAVAGAQPGWDSQPIFVASDGTVRQLNGYDPQVISPNWVQRLIESSDPANLRARVYIARGQAIWSLTGDSFTVEYNVGTGSWVERKSYLSDTWRGGPTVWAFGKWLVGDNSSTKLAYVDPSEHFDLLQPLPMMGESAAMFGVDANTAIFRFAVGVGSATGIDPIQIRPVVEISWSDDGGNVWSEPLLRSLGQQGEYNTRIELHRCAWQKGKTSRQGRKWRWRVSDPVPVIFLGAEVGMR